MPRKTNGAITVYITLITLALTALFSILIARATYRAMLHKDTKEFVNVVMLNDMLDSIRSVIVNEVASWVGV